MAVADRPDTEACPPVRVRLGGRKLCSDNQLETDKHADNTRTLSASRKVTAMNQTKANQLVVEAKAIAGCRS
jgi:hypothetical protein